MNYKITDMKENELKSNYLNYAEENTDTDGKIIITKRKIINVDMEIEYFIPKKTKKH